METTPRPQRSSDGSEPRENVQHANTEECAPDCKNYGGDAVHKSATPVQATPHVQPTPYHSGSPDKDDSTTMKRWKFGAELVGIAGGVILVFMTFLQYREMVTATKSSVKAVEVSLRQMGLTERQVILAEQSWIGVSKIAIAAYSPEHVGIRAELKNSGHTPARIETINVDVFVDDQKQTQNRGVNPVYNVTITDPADVAPGTEFPILINERKPIGNDAFEAVKFGKKAVHFHFKITYKDVFGQTRHTDACAFLSGKPEAMSEGGVIGRCGFSRMD